MGGEGAYVHGWVKVEVRVIGTSGSVSVLWNMKEISTLQSYVNSKCK